MPSPLTQRTTWVTGAADKKSELVNSETQLQIKVMTIVMIVQMFSTLTLTWGQGPALTSNPAFSNP